MKNIKQNKSNKNNIIAKTIEVLNNDGLVVFPSDTVYGLLANARSKKAIDELIAFKSRPIGKPISIFVKDIESAKHYVNISNQQSLIIDQLIPGAYTLVFPSIHNTDLRLESENGSLGIRIPEYKLINQLMTEYKYPVTATSANLSGTSPHYSIESLIKSLPKNKLAMIDLIIDADKLPRNKPSTVIDYSQDEIKILRMDNQNQRQIIETNSAQETIAFGYKIAAKYLLKNLKRPLIFMFEGEMGAGKTMMIKGIASFLGVNNIISPTFIIYYEYDIKIKPASTKFFHFDLFRIIEKQELNNLGIDDILKIPNILAIEWADRSGEIIEMLKSRAKIVYIKIEYLGRNKRKILINNI